LINSVHSAKGRPKTRSNPISHKCLSSEQNLSLHLNICNQQHPKNNAFFHWCFAKLRQNAKNPNILQTNFSDLNKKIDQKHIATVAATCQFSNYQQLKYPFKFPLLPTQHGISACQKHPLTRL
jgi:hypothetical protein